MTRRRIVDTSDVRLSLRYSLKLQLVRKTPGRSDPLGRAQDQGRWVNPWRPLRTSTARVETMLMIPQPTQERL